MVNNQMLPINNLGRIIGPFLILRLTYKSNMSLILGPETFQKFGVVGVGGGQKAF